MRKALYLLTLTLAVSSANAALVGWWKHDELSGDLIDATSGHPPGIATGTPTYGLPGVPNGTYGAITVNAADGTAIEYGPSTVDEVFTIGSDNNNPVMNLDRASAFTVMGWINPAQPTTGRSYKLLSTGGALGSDGGWGFALRLNNVAGTGSAVRFTTYSIADNDSSTFDVVFGNWIHLAATYNNGAINYFLNGNMLDADASVFNNDSAAARLVVGGRPGGNDTDQMNGLLDGVQVYDEVLTAEQIRAAAVGSVIPEPSAALLGLIGFCAMTRHRR